MKQKHFIALLILLLCFPVESSAGIDSTTLKNSLNAPISLVNIIYKNGVLNIKGLTGIGTIRIYSIIGNEVAVFNQVDLYDFQRTISLEPKTMYIIRIESMGEIKTLKLVTR